MRMQVAKTKADGLVSESLRPKRNLEKELEKLRAQTGKIP